MKFLSATLLVLSVSIQSLFMAWPEPARGMMQNLTEDQKQEAILHGKRGIRTELPEFIEEWSVNKKLEGFAFISTEFLSLAYASRQAALRMAELSKFEIDDTLAKSSGKLVFRVTLFGDSPDFSRNYMAYLRADGKTIPTSFWDNPSGEPYGDGESSPTYVADSDYYFPVDEVDPEGKITLVVQDEEENEVSSFKFDLGSLR